MTMVRTNATGAACERRCSARGTAPSAWWHRARIGMLCTALGLAGLSSAQPTALDKTTANATTHARVSDGDRVFMRSAAGRLIHDERSVDLAAERSASADVKAFAKDWRAAAVRHRRALADLARSHEVALPNDMAESSAQQVKALGAQEAGEFDAGFLRQAHESLAEEVKLFQDSVRKMENETVRAWANGVLPDLHGLAARAQALAAKSR